MKLSPVWQPLTMTNKVGGEAFLPNTSDKTLKTWFILFVIK
jgi:hypothetical protein